MAVYNRLLLTEGGGIQDESLKAEREDGLFICVGLGGTGKDAVRQLKKKVYNTLKSDNPDSPVPAYGNIKFLVVDSDPAYMDSPNVYDIDQNSEFFNISFPYIRDLLNLHDIIKSRKELSWLNHKNILVYDCEHGTGGVRQAGRFCLIDKAGKFKEKLTSLIQDGTGGADGKIRIHIFSGLSGGTGGGTFLDVCYIIRHVLEELGKKDAEVNGCFFLPDVNLSAPGVAESPFWAKHIKGYGYAALKELDYLMNLEKNHDHFVQDYGSFKIHTNRMPVDRCNLISSTASSGAAAEDGYYRALNTATDYVLSFLTKSFSSSGNPKPPVSEPEKRTYGAVFKYNFISVTHAQIPTTVISTYLGTKLFAPLNNLPDRSPTEKDLEDFISENNLSFQQIFDQLTEGISYNISYPENIKKAKDIIPGDRRVINYADTWIADVLEILTANHKGMTDKVNIYDIPKESVSLAARIFSSLRGAAMDPSKGPIFAAKLLNGPNAKNLQHMIDGYIQYNEGRLMDRLRQESSLKQALTDAEEKLAKASLINKRNRIDNYLEAMNQWYVHLAIVDSHNILKALLSELKNQVYRLCYEFFYPITCVLETLNNTFLENDQIFKKDSGKDHCSWQVPELVDIQTHLDNAVREIGPSRTKQGLIQFLFDNWHWKAKEDENEITLMICQYVNQKFASITHKDMEYWMEFADTTPYNIMKRLLDESPEPFLWKDPRFDGKIQRRDTLLIPACYHNSGITEALDSGDYCAPRFLYTNNRISLIRIYQDVPLFAWQGLEELEKVYEEDPSLPGRHLYEVGAVDWREYLPSPFPASFPAASGISRIRERNNKLTKEFQEARQAGIVRLDQEGWHIKQSKTGDMASVSEEARDFIPDKHLDMLKLTDLLDRIRTVREQMYADGNVEELTLSAWEAANGSEDQVLADDYLRCPVLQKIVSEELGKLRGINMEISKLESHCPGVCAPARPNREEDFFSAVFTGVIELKKDRILFSYEQFDLDIVLELQNHSMPYGTKAPLYQAYLTYKDLDTDLLEMIVKKTNETLDNMNDEIYEKSKQLQTRYTSDFLQMTLSKVAADPTEEEIKCFYNDFIRALQDHIITYR